MRSFLLLFFPLWIQASVCYFTPPAGWSCADPKQLSPHVQVGFIGESSSEFRPSINLALEKVDISLKDYVKAVKKIHLAQPNTTWRDLGRFKFTAGEGRLTEISTRSAWGDIKMLQALFIQGQTAYILTAAISQKDYIKEQKTLLLALQSLSLAPNLYTNLQEDLKLRFENFFQSLNIGPKTTDPATWKKTEWSLLQSLVDEAGAQMGSHWQFLALKEGHSQIYNSSH